MSTLNGIENWVSRPMRAQVESSESSRDEAGNNNAASLQLVAAPTPPTLPVIPPDSDGGQRYFTL